MTFKQTLEKIESSEIFQNFKKKHPNVELCAGFFIIDFLSNDNKKTLDYKQGKRIFTFTLKDNNEITVNEDKLIEDSRFPELQKIDKKVNIDLDEILSIAKQQALENGISAGFSKIIAILQKHKDKQTNKSRQAWNLTCILEGLIILNILVDSKTGRIIKFERKSMMDLIKKK